MGVPMTLGVTIALPEYSTLTFALRSALLAPALLSRPSLSRPSSRLSFVSACPALSVPGSEDMTCGAAAS